VTPVVAVIGNAEYAVDGANRTSDAGADRAANHGAYRTRCAAALTCAFVRTADNTLRVPWMRHREQCERYRRNGKMEPRRQTVRRRRCLDYGLRLHLDSSILGCDGRRGGTL
jgi:hypothetical protein